MENRVPILEVRDLCQYFRKPHSRDLVRAVDHVNMALYPGETLGIVGESGSGKSTLARSIAGLYRPTAGTITLQQTALPRSLWRRSKNQKRRIQMVFQNPVSALNPRRTVGQALALPLRLHQKLRGASARQRIAELLEMVELPAQYAARYPGALSGGQRQRVSIARALAAGPDVVILDEPTAALDVSVQAKIIDLLLALQRQMHLSYIFITHDISLVRTIADHVAVLYQGQVQEYGPSAEVFAQPRHPYSQLLIAAVPVITPEEERLKPPLVAGAQSTGTAMVVRQGCVFAPRCPHAMAVCHQTQPSLAPVGAVQVRCYLYEPGASAAEPVDVGTAAASTPSHAEY